MKKSEMTWYGPHECETCKERLGTTEGIPMIVKAGNGAPKSEQYNFTQDSHYPGHKFVKHKCVPKK